MIGPTSASCTQRSPASGSSIETSAFASLPVPPTTRARDLDRIFSTGVVAALVGNTYGAAKDVGVYVTGEAIRGVADLDAKERDRWANFASKQSLPVSKNGSYGCPNDRAS